MSGALASRLRAGQIAVGGWVALGAPRAAEVLARAGYDWVAIDLEHTGIGLTAAADCVAAIAAGGAAPLVRLPGPDAALIKQLLDAGAEGLIVPDVRSVETLRDVHAAMHYPPVGRRGVGLWRAQGWGPDFDAYCAAWPDRAVLVAQIESAEAVANLDALLAFPHLSAAMIGPYDLSASLGVPGQFGAAPVVEAVARVRAAAAAAGVPVGVHVVEPDPAALDAALDAGDRFVAYGVDFRFLDAGARAGVAVRDARV